jgi:hypothetical protein
MRTAAIRRLASANESATKSASRSDEKMEFLDLVDDLLIENAFHFWELNMACHTGDVGGGNPHVAQAPSPVSGAA